jgi:hypothetical protein
MVVGQAFIARFARILRALSWLVDPLKVWTYTFMRR